jgi:hypothetical protein
MEIEEAVKRSLDDGVIFIVKEALFCQAFEKSAWRFCAFLKPYKAVKKAVKKMKGEVVSIGFPMSQLPAILELSHQNGFSVVGKEAGFITISIPKDPDQAFESWKNDIPLYHKATVLPGKNDNIEDRPGLMSIVRDVEAFSVADHTPMQSMQFIMELQTKIKLVRKMPE